jgi:hypothetical protein
LLCDEIQDRRMLEFSSFITVTDWLRIIQFVLKADAPEIA